MATAGALRVPSLPGGSAVDARNASFCPVTLLYPKPDVPPMKRAKIPPPSYMKELPSPGGSLATGSGASEKAKV